MATKELSKEEYKETMGLKMIDITVSAEPIVDIWSYVRGLVYEEIVSPYVLENNLVEKVYRDSSSSFDHILLPTSNENVFIVIIVSINKLNIYGHYKLDLAKEYSTGKL